MAIRFADSKLKRDRDIIIKALKEDGLALEELDEDLKRDIELVKIALENSYGVVFEYIDDSLKKDKEILEIMEQYKEFEC